jgi:hypothetical protein
MMTGNREIDRDDDAAPVDMLASLFEARGWPCEFVGEDEVSGEIQGSWANYTVRGIWRREDHVLQLLCLPDIRVPDDKRAAMFEVLALVNEQLWVGHFDVWSSGGVLLYRHWRRPRLRLKLRLTSVTGSIPHSSSSCGVTRPRQRHWPARWSMRQGKPESGDRFARPSILRQAQDERSLC